MRLILKEIVADEGRLRVLTLVGREAITCTAIKIAANVRVESITILAWSRWSQAYGYQGSLLILTFICVADASHS